MKKENKKNKDFINELSATLSPERVKRAQKNAEEKILQIRLSELREKRGLKQEDIRSFSQSSVSKLESRKDIKISTLIEYLDNLGMGLEIKAYSKDKDKDKDNKKNDEFVLLKI